MIASLCKFSKMSEEFRALAREIISQPSIYETQLIQLDCEDLKRGLTEAARKLSTRLLDRVANDHRNEVKRCV